MTDPRKTFLCPKCGTFLNDTHWPWGADSPCPVCRERDKEWVIDPDPTTLQIGQGCEAQTFTNERYRQAEFRGYTQRKATKLWVVKIDGQCQDRGAASARQPQRPEIAVDEIVTVITDDAEWPALFAGWLEDGAASVWTYGRHSSTVKDKMQDRAWVPRIKTRDGIIWPPEEGE